MSPLTPADFHDRLDFAMPDSDADVALHPVIEADLAAGRRLLRRRRGLTVLGAAATVAVVVGGVGMVGVLGDAAPDDGIASAPTSTAELLESCRTGENATSTAAIDSIYGAGTPAVKAVARTDQRTVLAIESADGAYWGECMINLARNAEFDSYLQAYDARRRTTSSSYASGWACDLLDNGVDPACRDYFVSVVDRRPAEVAAVEFLTFDGVTTRVETVDGYFAFNHVSRLPEGAEPDSDGVLLDFMPLKRITFLDADGTPIAAEAQDGSGTGRDGERVGNLPSITEFPSLRGNQQL